MGIFVCNGVGTKTRTRPKSMIVLFNSCKYIPREDDIEIIDRIPRARYDNSESEGMGPERIDDSR